MCRNISDCTIHNSPKLVTILSDNTVYNYLTIVEWLNKLCYICAMKHCEPMRINKYAACKYMEKSQHNIEKKTGRYKTEYVIGL